MTSNLNAIEVHAADRSDAGRMADLHASRITEGFLPTLGVFFLTRLYRRVVMSGDAFAVVARDATGATVGFSATALDVSALYRRFMVRDGVVAGTVAAPRIARSWRRVLETLRYPSHAGAEQLPPAEVLAVAVDPVVAGRGVGRALVEAAQRELERRGVHAAKVVAGADNPAALALYRACGFEEVERIEVHDGIESCVLVWRVPALRVVRPNDAVRRDDAGRPKDVGRP